MAPASGRAAWLVSIGLHGAALGALLVAWEAPPEEPPGIEVEMAFLPATVEVSSPDATSVAAAPPPPSTPMASPPPDTVKPVEVAEVQPRPIEVSEVKSVTEAQTPRALEPPPVGVVAVEAVAAVEAEVVLPPAVKEVAVVEWTPPATVQPVTKPTPPPPRRVAAPPPPPQPPTRQPPPKEQAPKEQAVAQTAPSDPGPSTPTQQASLARPTASAASAPAQVASRTTSASGPPPDYAALISAALEARKVYPSAARYRGIQGTGLLRFTLRPDGTVTGWSLDRSAGHHSLDAAIARMVEGQAPLPPFPASLAATSLEFLVPVSFTLR